MGICWARWLRRGAYSSRHRLKRKAGVHVDARFWFLTRRRAQAGRAPPRFLPVVCHQMTPPKAAQGLINKALNAQVVMLPGGHQQMNETPEQMLAALRGFLRPDL